MGVQKSLFPINSPVTITTPAQLCSSDMYVSLVHSLTPFFHKYKKTRQFIESCNGENVSLTSSRSYKTANIFFFIYILLP